MLRRIATPMVRGALHGGASGGMHSGMRGCSSPSSTSTPPITEPQLVQVPLHAYLDSMKSEMLGQLRSVEIKVGAVKTTIEAVKTEVGAVKTTIEAVEKVLEGKIQAVKTDLNQRFTMLAGVITVCTAVVAVAEYSGYKLQLVPVVST